MEIIKTYGLNGDKKATYNLVHDTGSNLSDMVGQRIPVAAYLIIDTTDANGEVVRSLKVRTADGEIVGTTSKSFIQGFMEFCDVMETDEVSEFEVGRKKSKSTGRPYIYFIA